MLLFASANQPNLNVSILLQTLFINKFYVKFVLKLSAKCAKLLHILKKVRFIAFRRVTCFGISPNAILTTVMRIAPVSILMATTAASKQ